MSETKEMPKNIREIVKVFLEENGFDGLFYDSDCGCGVDDLAPCCDHSFTCEPAYRYVCTDKESAWFGQTIYGPKKPECPEPEKCQDCDVRDKCNGGEFCMKAMTPQKSGLMRLMKECSNCGEMSIMAAMDTRGLCLGCLTRTFRGDP